MVLLQAPFHNCGRNYVDTLETVDRLRYRFSSTVDYCLSFSVLHCLYDLMLYVMVDQNIIV